MVQAKQIEKLLMVQRNGTRLLAPCPPLNNEGTRHTRWPVDDAADINYTTSGGYARGN
jgi:hypothetical protein